MQRDVETGDEVLLNAESGNEEGVADVTGVEREGDGAVDWNDERCGDDVILRGDIADWIEPEIITSGIVDFIGVHRAESLIGAA